MGSLLLKIIMKNFVIKKSRIKGKGVFTNKDIKKGEKIFNFSLNILRKYSSEEIKRIKKINKEHLDYVGNGKYVVDYSTASYMNHSCNPNCYVKIVNNYERYVYALRNIAKGEELAHDYTATSIDQFGGKGFWKFKCNCKSKNCRKMIHGDFLKMPKNWQIKFYKHLPYYIKNKYKTLFKI